MSNQMVDVTIHLNEETTHADRESLRDEILKHKGVMSADYHDDKPHLMIADDESPAAGQDHLRGRGYGRRYAARDAR